MELERDQNSIQGTLGYTGVQGCPSYEAQLQAESNARLAESEAKQAELKSNKKRKRGKKWGQGIQGQGTQGNSQDMPFVSVCTPTFNRRPFIQTMFECFRNQTYPKSRIEWIIVDDGTDKIADLVEYSCIPQIKYFAVDTKMTLGQKRNYMHTKARGSILVYFDDDDYYPPERISHAVETLTNHPEAKIAGTSEIFLYFKPLNANTNANAQFVVGSENSAANDVLTNGKMVQFGPYDGMPNHCTAATFAFRRDILEFCHYNPAESLAEERAFLNDFTVPFVALDPLKTILVFSHNHNTFDKRGLLQAPWSNIMRPVSLTVDDFIRNPREAHIKRFFMTEVDDVLKTYAPGEVENKPDVIRHLARIRDQNAQLQQQQLQQQQQQIIHTDPATGEKRVVSITEVVDALKHVSNLYTELQSSCAELQSSNAELQSKYTELVDRYNALLSLYNQTTNATTTINNMCL